MDLTRHGAVALVGARIDRHGLGILVTLEGIFLFILVLRGVLVEYGGFSLGLFVFVLGEDAC